MKATQNTVKAQVEYRLLLGIAQRRISPNITTLEERKMDYLDFYDVAVWNLQAALREAYELGRTVGKGECHED